uniref:Transmembrane protein n=1 Tax=Heterorhabditis bacteriophora TaxID=37862 RepID=A0A1I7WK30_HETBA
MENLTLFDYHNDALLLFYNINSPVCLVLNLLAIYLISGNERISVVPTPLPEYYERANLQIFILHNMRFEDLIWVFALDIHVNVICQPVIYLPLAAGTRHGFFISKLRISNLACIVYSQWGRVAPGRHWPE